jgi:tetraacyldisaccharide 4'-kinase
MKKYFADFHYKQNYSFPEKVLYGVLVLVSYGYLLAIKLRELFYKLKIIKSSHPGVKVISIGNLTTGGTGKTPIVLEFAKHFTDHEYFKPAILSRGYGRNQNINEDIIPVKTGNEVLVDSPESCGDEPFMLANLLEDITILVGPRRLFLAHEAVLKYNNNLLILDDGFQHLAVKRDLNIVLIDSQKILGNKQLLPAGPLREPISALERSDAIILVNKNPTNIVNDLQLAFLKKFNKPVYKAEYKFECYIDLKTGQNLSTIPENEMISIAAIARPEYFHTQLKNLGLNILKNITFDDHYTPLAKDIESILVEAAELNAGALVTTQKDAVKLMKYLDKFDKPVYALQMKMYFNITDLLTKTRFYG